MSDGKPTVLTPFYLERETTDDKKTNFHNIFAFTFGILDISVAVVQKLVFDSFPVGGA